MRIGIDLDDVLGDTMPALLEFHNSVYNTNLKKDEIFSYDFVDIFGGSHEENTKKVYDFYKTPHFENITPVENAVEAIKKLKKDHELFIITSRQDLIINETEKWVDKHFSNMITDVYFASHYYGGNNKRKSDFCNALNVDVFIDDHFAYATECVSPNRKVILFRQPWNEKKDVPAEIYRVSGWKDILSIV